MKTVASSSLSGSPVDVAPARRRFGSWPPWLNDWMERVDGSGLGRRLVHGAFWSLAGAGLARGLGLLASVATARLLGAELFGELGVIQGTVGMFGVFAGFGLGLTATKHVAEFRKTDPARAGRVLVLSGRVAFISGLGLALILAAMAPYLATHSLAAPHLAGALRIGAALVWLGAVNGAQTGALAGFEAFKPMARAQFRSGLAAVPLVVGGVLLDGMTGAVWGLVGSLAVNCGLNHLAVRAEARQAGVPLRGGNLWEEWGVLWGFSLPAMLCSVMILPVNWAGMALLAHQPGGYEELGIFNAANQWRTAILFVPQALAGIVLPALAGLGRPEQETRYQRVLYANVGLVSAVALVLALGVIAGSGWIMSSYGVGFARGQTTLILLAGAAVVMAVNQVLGADVISRNRMWAGLGCNAVWAAVFVLLAWRWIPGQGATGLAWAVAGSYPVHALALWWVSRWGKTRRQSQTRGGL